MMDHVTSAVVTVPCSDNGKISIEPIRARSSIKAKTENEKPKIAIEVWVEGNVGDVQCTIDLSKTENIYSLEKKIGEKIKGNMEAAVKKAQINSFPI
ncbi:Ger(x)C family spore germination C-terminal domain-containing protein [Wukongibacter sp. M2B1]|uniref:Ger(x)C family spore germination C-terminal domain-containing protein n=1 Tax=Wukongibacter sp. M2B1 TaxID=3088895 RepID=UPI003D7923BE